MDFEPRAIPLHFAQAKCPSARLSCWHRYADAWPAAHLCAPSLLILLFSAEIFERIGPRERRALWDPFGAVQCELRITSRYQLVVLADWLRSSQPQQQRQPGLSRVGSRPHSLCPLCALAVAFAFGRLHWIKATAAQQGQGREEGPGRLGPASIALAIASL